MTHQNWMSVSDAARAIGISRQAVHQRIKTGTIEARQEPTTRSPRGYFWAVNPDSVAAIAASRLAYAEDMQSA